MHEIFNIVNVLGTISLIFLLLAVGFGGGGHFFISLGCMAVFAITANIAVKEDGGMNNE